MKKLLVGCLFFVACDTSTAGNTDGGSPGSGDLAGMMVSMDFQNEFLTAHNDARHNAMPTPAPALVDLTWSNPAAQVAAEWAAGCVFNHNPNRGQLGENVFAGSGAYSPTDVVDSWVSEVADYTYASNSCSDVCGHYTQVVWRSTTAVGCAMKKCTTGSPFGAGAWELWVCNYSPPGNFVNQKPY